MSLRDARLICPSQLQAWTFKEVSPDSIVQTLWCRDDEHREEWGMVRKEKPVNYVTANRKWHELKNSGWTNH